VRLSKVIGTIVSTRKNEHLRGRKTSIVQPVVPEGNAAGLETV